MRSIGLRLLARHRSPFRLSLLLLMLGASAPPSAEEREAPLEPASPLPSDESDRAGRVPAFLKGVDLARPAQEAFRGWPPPEVVERPFWLPWDWLAVQRAKLFDRPIFFMMTVPWNRLAQRMQLETLADPKVQRVINDGFISVLVSADRRPDIQERYQTGTWPVEVFLLPDGDPMLSQANEQGVALPITMSYLKPDELLFLLEQARLYFAKWPGLLRGVGKVWTQREGKSDPVPGAVNEAASDQMARWLLGSADRQNGGFGVAPKFPVRGLMEYASLREARLVPALVDPARQTLDKLVASPLYDSRYGGVHRIAVTPNWGDIHYEKLLEVNTLLARDLIFALRNAESSTLRKALIDTCGFITRVLGRPGGGFYNAQCADPRSSSGGDYWTQREPGAAPPLDHLVLAGANALAGAALLRAGGLLGDPAIEAAGRDAMSLVYSRAYEPGRGADHVIEPNPENRRFLTAQADVAFGFIDAYESTGEKRYLDAAKDIVDFALNNLQTAGETALRDHLPEASPLSILANPRRPMVENVHLARVMTRLASQGPDYAAYREKAISILGTFSGELSVYGVHGTEAALAVEELVREPLVIRIEGPPGDPTVQSLRRAALSLSWPWTLVRTGSSSEALPATAVLSRAGASTTISRPEQMAGEVKRLTIDLPTDPGKR